MNEIGVRLSPSRLGTFRVRYRLGQKQYLSDRRESRVVCPGIPRKFPETLDRSEHAKSWWLKVTERNASKQTKCDDVLLLLFIRIPHEMGSCNLSLNTWGRGSLEIIATHNPKALTTCNKRRAVL